MGYTVLIEKGKNSYGASVPDLPGCVAAAKTYGEVKKLIKEAIDFHLEGMREDGDPIPTPSTRSIFVRVKPLTGSSKAERLRIKQTK